MPRVDKEARGGETRLARITWIVLLLLRMRAALSNGSARSPAALLGNSRAWCSTRPGSAAACCNSSTHGRAAVGRGAASITNGAATGQLVFRFAPLRAARRAASTRGSFSVRLERGVFLYRSSRRCLASDTNRGAQRTFVLDELVQEARFPRVCVPDHEELEEEVCAQPSEQCGGADATSAAPPPTLIPVPHRASSR